MTTSSLDADAVRCPGDCDGKIHLQRIFNCLEHWHGKCVEPRICIPPLFPSNSVKVQQLFIHHKSFFPPNCFLIKCCECAHAQIKMGSWECWQVLQLNGHDQCSAQHKVSENFPKQWPFLLAQLVLVSSINGWISLNMTDDLIQYSASPFFQQGVTNCGENPGNVDPRIDIIANGRIRLSNERWLVFSGFSRCSTQQTVINVIIRLSFRLHAPTQSAPSSQFRSQYGA